MASRNHFGNVPFLLYSFILEQTVHAMISVKVMMGSPLSTAADQKPQNLMRAAGQLTIKTIFPTSDPLKDNSIHN
jgi:hypothetical protein